MRNQRDRVQVVVKYSYGNESINWYEKKKNENHRLGSPKVMYYYFYNTEDILQRFHRGHHGY